MRKQTLTLDHLTTGYRRKGGVYLVAEQLSASLFSGELTCLIGANGCGKSTLLRTLTAFQPPLSGTVQISGKDLGQYSREELSRLVGVVLTDRIEERHLQVDELVAMGRMPYTGFWGSLSAADRRVVDEAIDQVGVRALARRPLYSLSDGELQKVLVAKTLAQETPFIFLDEPTAFLDYPSKLDLFLLLRRLAREQQKTVFLSTHDLDLALQLADRLWLLDRQRGLCTGVPEDLAAQGILSDFFQHAQLSFSPEQMTYQVRMPVHFEIQVTGTAGPRQELLCRALARLGGACVGGRSQSGLSVTVREESPYYVLFVPGQEAAEMVTIEELLYHLQSFLPV